MLLKLNNFNKIVGTKQVKRALKAQIVESVFIANDADPKVIKEIEEICIANSIEIFYIKTMKELGDACGIDVTAATAAIKIT